MIEGNIFIINLTDGSFKALEGIEGLDSRDFTELDDYIVSSYRGHSSFFDKRDFSFLFSNTILRTGDDISIAALGNKIVGLIYDTMDLVTLTLDPPVRTLDVGKAGFTNTLYKQYMKTEEPLVKPSDSLMPDPNKILSNGVHKFKLHGNKLKKVSVTPNIDIEHFLEMNVPKKDDIIRLYNSAQYPEISAISKDGKKIVYGSPYGNSNTVETIYDNNRRSSTVSAGTILAVRNVVFNEKENLAVLMLETAPFLQIAPVVAYGGIGWLEEEGYIEGNTFIKAGNKLFATYSPETLWLIVSNGDTYNYSPTEIEGVPSTVSFVATGVTFIEGVGNATVIVMMINGQCKVLRAYRSIPNYETVPHLTNLIINDYYFGSSGDITFVAHSTGFNLYDLTGNTLSSSADIFEEFKVIPFGDGVYFMLGKLSGASNFKLYVYDKNIGFMSKVIYDNLFDTPLNAFAEWQYNGDILVIREALAVKIYKLDTKTMKFIVVANKDGYANSICVFPNNAVYIAYGSKVKEYVDTDDFAMPIIFDETGSAISNRIIEKMYCDNKGMFVLENYTVSGTSHKSINYINTSRNIKEGELDPTRVPYFHSKDVFETWSAMNSLPVTNLSSLSDLVFAESENHIGILTNTAFSLYKKDGVSLIKMFDSLVPNILAFKKFAISDNGLLVGISASTISVYNFESGDLVPVNLSLPTPYTTNLLLEDVAISEDGKFIVVVNDNYTDTTKPNVFSYKQTSVSPILYLYQEVTKVNTHAAFYVDYYPEHKSFIVAVSNEGVTADARNKFVQYKRDVTDDALTISTEMTAPLYHSDAFGISYNQDNNLKYMQYALFAPDLSFCILSGPASDIGDAVRVMRLSKGVNSPEGNFYRTALTDTASVRIGKNDVAISKNNQSFMLIKNTGVFVGSTSPSASNDGIIPLAMAGDEGEYPFAIITRENTLLTISSDFKVTSSLLFYTSDGPFPTAITGVLNAVNDMVVIPDIKDTFLGINGFGDILLLSPVYNIYGLSNFSVHYLTIVGKKLIDVTNDLIKLKVVHNKTSGTIYLAYSGDESGIYSIDIVSKTATYIDVAPEVVPYKTACCFSQDGKDFYVMDIINKNDGGLINGTTITVYHSNASGDFVNGMSSHGYTVEYTSYNSRNGIIDMIEVDRNLYISIASEGLVIFNRDGETYSYRAHSDNYIKTDPESIIPRYNPETNTIVANDINVSLFIPVGFDEDVPVKPIILDFDLDSQFIYVLSKYYGAIVETSIDKFNITTGAHVAKIKSIPFNPDYGTIKKIDDNIYISGTGSPDLNVLGYGKNTTITCMRIDLEGGITGWINFMGARHNIIKFEKAGTSIYVIATVKDADLFNGDAASFVGIANADFSGFDVVRELYPDFITDYSIVDDGIDLYMTDDNMTNGSQEFIVDTRSELE